MSCTETEAKTKWCPFYRVATSGGGHDTYEIDNRPIVHEKRTVKVEGAALYGTKDEWHPTEEIEPVARCIGSRCMAWQWNGIRHHCGKTDMKVPCDCLPVGDCGMATR